MQFIREIIDNIGAKPHVNATDPALVTKQLDSILSTLLLSTDDISGAIVSTVDGNAKAQKLADNMDENRFAAMSSALLALSDNLAAESSKGATENVLIEGNHGKILIMHAGPQLLLTVFTRQGANLGMSLAHARVATQQLSAVMEALR
jgi:uncharacterized protein